MTKRNRPKQGIVLISVLLIMNLITFLVLIGLQSSELEMRMSHNQYIDMKNRTMVSAILKSLEKQLVLKLSSCQIDKHPSNAAIIVMPDSWWKSSSICQGRYSNYRYHYFFSILQHDPKCYLLTLRVTKANISMIEQISFEISDKKKKVLSWRKLK